MFSMEYFIIVGFSKIDEMRQERLASLVRDTIDKIRMVSCAASHHSG
jgi:hypothetical protein